MKELKIDKALEERWQEIEKIRDIVLKVLEAKRVSGIIGSSLEAKVLLYSESEKSLSLLKRYEKLLPEIFIVSQAELLTAKAADMKEGEGSEIFITVEKAEGEKCPRCWNYSLSVGKSKDHPQICDRCQRAL